MNSEESRLRTFANWPENAVVDARRIATAGFYYMGRDQEVQCFSCGGRISEWNIGDSVMGRHRALDPNCPFVQDPVLSGNIPLINDSRSSPNTSQDNRSYYHVERARLETFATWPIRSIVSPELLAKSGFYYLQVKDKVRCAYCNGVIQSWEAGDDPDSEHLRHLPNCSFIKSKTLAEMNVTYHSGVDIRHTSTDASESNSETLKDLGVQDHRLARHPKFATLESRLVTFEQWPPSLNQKPHDMAEAGFYFTGRGDQVRCFHCDGGLRLWEREDDPWLEHARWFPNCGFILLVKGQEFVDEANGSMNARKPLYAFPKTRSESPTRKNFTVTDEELQELMNSPDARAALQMGIDSTRIKQALRQRMESVGAPYATLDALVIATLEAQREQISASECDDWATPPDSPSLNRGWRPRVIPRSEETDESDFEYVGGDEESMDEADDIRLPHTPPTPLPERPPASPPVPPETPIAVNEREEENGSSSATDKVKNSLEEENRRLKEARLCKICMDSEVVVVFLPCRHLVTCPTCAPSLSDCPLCRQPIKATVRTFLS